jgi:hypothetical protein
MRAKRRRRSDKLKLDDQNRANRGRVDGLCNSQYLALL